MLRTEKNWGKEMLMHFETYIGLAAFLYITVVLTIQIIGRYLFRTSWAWIEETSVIGYVILIYCGVSGAFTAWLTYYLYQIILNMLKLKQVYSVTRMPRVYVYIFMAVMLALSVLRAVQEIIKLTREQEQELGKAKPAFDLDAIWEEGRAAREAYLAQQKSNEEGGVQE